MRAFSASFARRGARPDSNSHTTDHQTAQTPVSAPRLVKSRSIALFSKAPKQPLETIPAVPFLPRTSGGKRPDLTPASSASSDGSSSLRTPEDEGLMAFPSNHKPDEKKKWPTWLSWRKSADRESEQSASEHGDRIPPHVSHRALGISTQTGPPTNRRSVSDTTEDDESVDSGDEYDDDAPTPVSKSRTTPIPPRSQVVQAQSNGRTLLRNALVPVNSPPPLVDGASQSFPRSTAPVHRCPRIPSLEELLLTRRLLHRLDRRHLTLAEARSIVAFANKPQIKAANRIGAERTKLLDYESVADVSMRVGRFSRGLRRWATRPCFEQRFRVWAPDASGNVIPTNVTGVERPVAICDLEFSEWVETLAGLCMDDAAFDSAIFHSFNTREYFLLSYPIVSFILCERHTDTDNSFVFFFHISPS